MTIIIQRECWFCDSTYGYMVSGYGVSPSRWNNAKGVGYHYCSECADRVTPFHTKMWRLRDDIEKNLGRMDAMFNDPDGWFAWCRVCKKWPVRRVYADLISVGGVISVQPMPKPTGEIFFLDFKWDGSKTGG